MMTQSGQWIPDYAGQQPYSDPAFVDFMRRHNMLGNGQNQQGGQPQMMTPPTIDAKIIQIMKLDEMDSYAVAPGTSQMFITKDETHIAIRSMYANGQHSDDIYDKRPPAPPAPTLNPDDYVRRDEMPELVAQAIQAQAAQKTKHKEAEVA